MEADRRRRGTDRVRTDALNERSGRPAPTARARGERGSALLLIPAGFLAFLVLAALAFDQSRLLAVRRQLIDVAASAANDAVAASVDQDAYRADGAALAPQLVLGRAEAEVAASLAARGLDDVRAVVTVDDTRGAPRVVVRLESDLPTIFARLAPGGYGRTRVAVASSATFNTF